MDTTPNVGDQHETGDARLGRIRDSQGSRAPACCRRARPTWRELHAKRLSREEILSARFDIQATAVEDVPVAQQRALLRRLLEERSK